MGRLPDKKKTIKYLKVSYIQKFILNSIRAKDIINKAEEEVNCQS
jgi:hypothetical protein